MRLISILVLLLATAPALAGHHGHHGHRSHHGHIRFGIFIGPPLFGPWWWMPPPVYYGPPAVYAPPPVIYREPVIVRAPPPNTVVTEQPPSYPKPANNGVAQTQLPSDPSASYKQSYVYPRQGQSAQQQAQDEAECNTWASTQMGSGTGADQAAANFQRALAACLDAHGYSVR